MQAVNSGFNLFEYQQYLEFVDPNSITRNICSRLNLSDLKSFASVNKCCLIIFTEYVKSAPFHEIQKKMIEEGCFPSVIHLNEKNYYEMSTNQCAVTKNDIFFHSQEYEEAIGVHTTVIYKFNLGQHKIKKRILVPNMGCKIKKIVSSESGIYLLTEQFNKKSIMINKIVKLDSNLAKVKYSVLPGSYSGIKKNLISSSLLEVYGDELFIDIKPSVIGIFNRMEVGKERKMKLMHTIDFTDYKDSIVATKIDRENLYVRLAKGLIHIFDLKTKCRNIIKGPSCDFALQHFDIKDGYLYTADKLAVTKWKFTPLEGGIEKIGQFTNLSSKVLSFQLDEANLYLGLLENGSPSPSMKVFDCNTFECLNDLSSCKSLSDLPSKINLFANEGVLFSIEEFTKREHKSQCRFGIVNLNDYKKKMHSIDAPEKPNDALENPKVSKTVKPSKTEKLRNRYFPKK